MTTEVTKAGKSTWAASGRPTANHQGATRLPLEDGAALAYAIPRQNIPRDAVLLSASYTWFAAGASTGSRTLTLRQPSEHWRPGQLTWDNRPAVAGASATATVGALADGDPIVFDVLEQMQAVLDGTVPPYGWRLSTSTSTRHKVYGYDSDHPPVLEYSYGIPGGIPTDLSPSAGVVSVPKPVLTWTYLPAEDADLDAVKVQIDSAQDGATADFDSGWVTSTSPDLDLATTAYGGLTSGVTTYWRVNVRDDNGIATGWSDWAPITYRTMPTLTISTPDASGYVYDATPQITWSLSGGTQKAWQVRVVRVDDLSDVIYDTGKRTGTATGHTLPKGVLYDESTAYVVIVRVWDNYDREATPGHPTFVAASQTFLLADGVTGAPTDVTASPDRVTPAVTLTWVSDTAPDSFTIVRDGKILDSQLDPEDYLLDGETYSYTDWTATPRVEHEYQIRAVTAGEQSARSVTAYVTTTPKGVWLIDTITETWVCASGTGGIDSWARADTYAMYQPIGATKPVKITSATAGLAGQFAGSFKHRDPIPRTVEEQLENLNTLLEHPDRVLRLVAGDINIPVIVANLHAATHPDLMKKLDRVRVGWDFWQYGELDFKPRL